MKIIHNYPSLIDKKSLGIHQTAFDELAGASVQVEEDCPCVPQGWCRPNFQMPRADVAKFMIDIAETNEYHGKAVAIALP